MDKKYMKRAIGLAKKGEGYTNPNPLVGAVIVKDGRIIGEGFHEIFGGPHAEINAFRNAREDVEGATMYVTLEPCSHYGKTPPCADAIIQKKLSKVVIGMMDPNPKVSGNGIKKLQGKGIEVVSGVLEDEVKVLNEIFIKYITTKEPFGLLKTAMTLDGKIATYVGDAKWITNESSRDYVHQIRHRMASILVGIGTVLADDPKLTTRLEHIQGRDPLRVIVDTSGRIPLEANVLNLASTAKTILATTEKADPEKLKKVEDQGGEVLMVPIKDEKVDLKYLFKKLGEKGVDSILVEGGGTINYSALQAGIVDKIMAFIAPKIIGGKEAITPVGGKGIPYMKDAIMIKQMQIKKFNEDLLIEGYLERKNK